MKRTLRLLIWIFGCLIVTLLILLLAIYFALKSPSLNQSILNKWVKPALAEEGVAFDIKNLSLDLFKGLRGDQLVVNIDSPDLGKLDISFSQFIFDYDFLPLLRKQLFLNELSLSGLKIKGDLKIPPSDQKKPEEIPPEPASEESKDLYSILEKPPILASIKKVLINITEIDLNIALSENDQLKLLLGEFNLNQELSLVADKLSFLQSLTYGTPKGKQGGLSLSYLSKNPETGENLSFRTLQNFSYTLKGHLENQEQKTLINLEQLKIQTDVADMLLDKSSTETPMHLEVPALAYELNLGLSFSLSKQASISDINNILPLKFSFKHDLTSSPITFLSESPEQKMSLITEASGDGNLDAIIASFESPAANTLNPSSLTFGIKNLSLNSQTGKEQTQISLDSQKIALSHPKNSSKFDFLLSSQSRNLMVKPVFVAPLTFEADILSEFLGGFTSVKQNIAMRLNKENFLSGDLSLYQEEHKGSANYALKINYPLSLEKILKNFSLSKDLGLLGARISGASSWVLADKEAATNTAAQGDSSVAESELKAGSEPLPFRELSGTSAISLVQDAKGRRPKFYLNRPLDIKLEYKINEEQNIQLKTDLELNEFSLPGVLNLKNAAIGLLTSINKEHITAKVDGSFSKLKLVALPKALDLGLKNNSDLILKPFSLRNKLQLAFNHEDMLHLETVLNDLPQNLKIESKLHVLTPKDLDSYIVQLKDIPGMGSIGIDLNVQADLGHSQANIVGAAKVPQPDKFKIASSSELNINQTSAPQNAGKKIIIPKPIKLTLKTTPREEGLLTDVNLNIGEAYFAPLGGIEDLQIKSAVELKDFNLPSFKGIKTLTHLSIKDIPILDPELKSAVPEGALKAIDLALNAEVDEGQKLSVEKFIFKLNRLLQVTAQGKVNPKDITASLGGRIDLNPSLEPWHGGDLEFSGGIKIPWHVAALANQNFTLSSEVQFKNFNLEFAPKKLSVKDLAGKISVQEEFNLDEKGRLGFAYLIPSNPFERTDFSKHRPLLDTDALFIKNLSFDQYTLGPIRAAIALKQNMFNLHQFDLNAFGGTITGELGLNIHPKFLALRLISRITQLHPDLITLQQSEQKDNYINLRTAILYDINKALIEGSINVDKIGSQELISLINVLDPRYEDDQLNSARTALNLAYPTFVNMTMDQGQMDMIIDLDALGISKTLEIRKIPLYAFVASATDELLQKIREVPIQ